MSKVNILSPDVISKIAAGEIIERPASVIKELIENALDAKATNLEIHLKDAGKTLINMKDNGIGIDEDDLEKIFLRHATSKINQIDDLTKILSLGFRGEALYSIAAISDVLLRSKTKEQDTAWEIHMRGGQKLTLRPSPMPTTGTEIEVKELFFNTPARKKFLKSNTTELNQILNIVLPYGLLYPKHRFLLTHQGRDLLDLPPTKNLLSRIAQALNLNEQHLIENHQNFEEQNLSIHMVLGDMNIKRPRRDMQFIFVNTRPVQHRNIGFHLNQIYRLIFPPNEFPFFAVYIKIDPQTIDVNIHPTKREVKIKNEQILYSILRAMCEQTLMTQGKPKQVQLPPVKGQHKSTASTSSEPVASKRTFEGIRSSKIPFDPAAYKALFAVSRDESLKEISSRSYAVPNEKPLPSSESQKELFGEKRNTLKDKLCRARYIGSFINKYLLFEIDRSLIMIDQHAAQERISYEALKKQIEEGNLEVQGLLSPILINVIPQEMLAWEEGKEKLKKLGLETTLFDTETIALHSYPHLIKNPELSLKQLLSSGENILKGDHDSIARRACRLSVMAGDPMTKEQAEYQREQLLQCLDPFTCPHGRPIMIEMEETFFSKQFLRT